MPVYPSNAVQTKIFPTCTLGTVSKFDPSTKYKEEEEIVDETGVLKDVVSVDLMTEVDVEIVMFPNQTVPTPVTSIAFNYANSTLGTGTINFLIRGEVKTLGNAGKAKRIGFKMMNNSNLP